MKTEIYNNLFSRLSELGAIRKDFNTGCEYLSSVDGRLLKVVDQDEGGTWSNQKVIGHPPVLSDCIYAIERIVSNRHGHWEYLANVYWDFRKPYLHQQSDELGEKLFTLIK